MADAILSLADIALSLIDKGKIGTSVSRNLYSSAKKESKEAIKKEVVKDTVSETGKQVLKKESGNIPKNITEGISKEKNTKSVADILKGLKDITKNKRKSPKNFESSGGYEQAVKDFLSLNPVNVKEIQTQYGSGKFGTLDNGTKIVARRGSKSSGATLEITDSNGKIYKIRY